MNSRGIFFFDWDGTLSIGNRPVSHADRCALKELQKQGHRLFLCTGRAGAICSRRRWNSVLTGSSPGPVPHVTAGDRELLCHTIPCDTLRPLVALFLERGQGCILESAAGMILIHMETPMPVFTCQLSKLWRITTRWPPVIR